MALVTLRPGSGAEAPLNVISAESDGGTSATFIGGDIQPFTGIVVDTTFADTHWHTQQCATEVALPVIVPHAGGPVKFSIDFPVDELINPKSVRITVGYVLEKRDAAQAIVPMVVADNIVLCNDKYPIKKTTFIINNQPQFGTMLNRDHEIIARRLRLLQLIRSDWVSSIKRLHACKNGFLPNHQTKADNRIGKSGIYADIAAAGDRTAFADCPPSTTVWADEVKHLVKDDTASLLAPVAHGVVGAAPENFFRVESESEGIMGASCMYPGIITNFQCVLDFKSIYEWLYSDLTNGHVPVVAVADTHGIERAFIKVTKIFVEYQSLLPSTPLWDALSNAATAGGGVAKSPSYPIELVQNYGGPKEFTAGSTAIRHEVTGSDVPDILQVATQTFNNQNTKSGNQAFLDWPKITKQSFGVTTQGREAFKNTGDSLFAASAATVDSLDVMTHLSTDVAFKYQQWFKGTIARNFKTAQGRPLEDYSHFLDDPTAWIHGNAFNMFPTSTCLSTQNDLKSPVYAAPFVVHSTLAAPLELATSDHFVGVSKAVLVNSQNSALIASRYITGTSVDAVLDKMRGDDEMEEVEEPAV